MIIPVIMCGGAGTRLWPLSRETRPKPLLPLVGGVSTFAATLHRVAEPGLFGPPLIVANRDHRYMLAAALAETGVAGRLLLEPEPRDTTAAIAAAAQWIASDDPDAILLFLAADHLIRDVEGFRRTVRAARRAAADGAIVTFGIRPTYPATGYGYIERGEPLPGVDGVHRVAAFVEKPDAATAERYIAAGHLWNSGNFMMPAALVLSELAAHAPDILAATAAAVEDANIEADGAATLGESFRSARKISFDHAVMEKTVAGGGDRRRLRLVGPRHLGLGLGRGRQGRGAERRRRRRHAGLRLRQLRVERPADHRPRRRRRSDRGGERRCRPRRAARRSPTPSRRWSPRSTRKPEALIGDRARHYRPWGWYQSIDIGPGASGQAASSSARASASRSRSTATARSTGRWSKASPR